MRSKSEQTSEFIIETVAPIFNKQGYNGTSMSDLTKATGLTKGAIYGNFTNKEELSFLAFKYNVDRVVSKIKEELTPMEGQLQKLYGLTNFYRKYKSYTIEFGGCPILNIGVDANNQNPDLLKKVQDVVYKLQSYITKMIEKGIENGEIRNDVNPVLYSKKIFTLIEGAVFMSSTMNDDSYIQEIMACIDGMIKDELAK